MATFRMTFERKHPNGQTSYTTSDHTSTNTAEAKASAVKEAQVAVNMSGNDPRATTKVERID